MFPLFTRSLPTTVADLANLMNESVKRLFVTTGESVTVEAVDYPALNSISIKLDDASLRADRPTTPITTGARSPAFQVLNLLLEGSRISIGPATIDLRLRARDVRLDQARDGADEIILLLRSAAAGEVEIIADKSELEKAIAAIAGREAGKQGVTIEDVSLTLRERGLRSLSAEVQVKARKLFFSTVIRIAADLDLDNELNAAISGLACKGDGAIGTLACGVLAPHLEKLDGRTFSLLALPLGDIRLRDVRLAVADKICVTAQFSA